MSDPLDQQLLGHLLDALDDDEQETLDARLERDVQCCRRLAGWRQRLSSLETMRPDFEPPRGLAERTCRYVAACMPAVAARKRTPRMTPEPTTPGPANAVRWPDLVAVVLVLMAATAVLFPAIANSRSQSRVAMCQAGLRQFGLALVQYSDQHRKPFGQLVVGGQLTGIGASAVQRLRDVYSRENPHDLCSDGWLAAQGVLGSVKQTSNSPAPQPPCGDDWLGTRRNGTNDEWQLPLIATSKPLLADAPGADLPGQPLESHEGRGRNVFFEDGHVAFVPAVSIAPAGWGISGSDALSGPSDPTLIQFVSRRGR